MNSPLLPLCHLPPSKPKSRPILMGPCFSSKPWNPCSKKASTQDSFCWACWAAALAASRYIHSLEVLMRGGKPCWTTSCATCLLKKRDFLLSGRAKVSWEEQPAFSLSLPPSLPHPFPLFSLCCSINLPKQSRSNSEFPTQVRLDRHAERLSILFGDEPSDQYDQSQDRRVGGDSRQCYARVDLWPLCGLERQEIPMQVMAVEAISTFAVD